LHRRLLLVTSLLVGLAACVTGCGGLGDSYCSPDDTTCVDPTPTDPPAPGPSECASEFQVWLLYPLDASDLASYAGTMYVSFMDGIEPSSYLALAIVFTQPGQTLPAGTETGTTIQPVTNLPDALRGTVYDNIYSSSNLPLPPNRTAIVTLVDTRTPAKCPGVQLATIDTTTHSVQRVPAVRGVRASASRSAVQTVLRGGRF
jgi:hypothetical protein